MAYIGKAPNTAIVNQATSQSFSGNGSTTAFTLTRSVNVGEDLEVFVNNVQQEPGSGKSYTASGTTLTFDEAPPSGTNNVYVIYRGEATINPRLEHDANAALAATTGTFSGAVSGTTGTFSGDLTVDTNTLKVDSTNNNVGIGTSSPNNNSGRTTLTIDNASQGGAIDLEHNGTVVGKFICDGENTLGIQADGNRDVLFKTNGSSRMLLSGSGHVGINNTAPGSYLEGELTVGNSTKDQYINVVTGSGNAAGLCFQDTTGTSIVGGLRYTHSDNALASWTNGSERMRLSSSGDLILGTTSTIGPAQFNVDGGSQAGIGIRAGNGTSGYFNQVLFANNANTALIGSIQRVNNASIQYNTTSDARLKENIADMTGAITRVKQLVPKRYSWVEEDLDAADQDGFLAHEAQAVVPGAVSGTQDEVDGDGNPVYMQMDYSKLVPLLTAALKESIAKIETLEAKVAALEGN